jgi:hypothetical protein
MGGTFVRRGQRLARDEEVPREKARKGQHRCFADRLEPERQARLLAFGGRRPKKIAQRAALRPPAKPPAMRSVAPGSIVRAALGSQQGLFYHAGKLSEFTESMNTVSEIV